MDTNLIDIVALTILESDEFSSYGVAVNSRGEAVLDPEFLDQIAQIIQTETKRVMTRTLISEPFYHTNWLTATLKALTELGEKKQATFRNIEVASEKMHCKITLEINLLYPYHWFPLTFTMEF